MKISKSKFFIISFVLIISILLTIPSFVSQDVKNKLPKSLREFIKNNKSNFQSNIDPTKDLKDHNLLYETKVFLSLLYRDYWAPDDVRKKLQEEDKKETKGGN